MTEKERELDRFTQKHEEIEIIHVPDENREALERLKQYAQQSN